VVWSPGEHLVIDWALRAAAGRGATTLRRYADPVSEVDRPAAAYLAQLTAGSQTDALREARSLPVHALAAPIAPVMARLALAALDYRATPATSEALGPRILLLCINVAHDMNTHQQRTRRPADS
jgi:hypothetical protein